MNTILQIIIILLHVTELSPHLNEYQGSLFWRLFFTIYQLLKSVGYQASELAIKILL